MHATVHAMSMMHCHVLSITCWWFIWLIMTNAISGTLLPIVAHAVDPVHVDDCDLVLPVENVTKCMSADTHALIGCCI